MLEANICDNQELSHLIRQATSSREPITLIQEGQQKAVLLSLEMFQYLVGVGNLHEQLLVEEFANISRQSFMKSGYESTEKVMALIQEVKQELLSEREQRLNARKIST